MINELPGLVGALQPLNGAQSPNEQLGRQNRLNVANAMLAAASGLLAPNSKQNPLGLAQKLGAGLGTGLQSHNAGTGQERLLHALGMNGRGLSAAIPTSLAGLAGMAPALRLASGPTAPEPAAEKSVASDRHPAQRARRSARRANTARKPAPPAGPTLQKFSGSVARRLEDPAVLPGGWELYGYDKKSDRPVYVGPGQELRVLA